MIERISIKQQTTEIGTPWALDGAKKQPDAHKNPPPRDELANIENKILEKKIADKKKEELRKKNIAVSFITKDRIHTIRILYH